MKKLTLCLAATAAMIASVPCLSAEGWLLVGKDGRQSLVYATRAGIQQVATLGNSTVYDNTGDKIAIVTRDYATKSGKLLVVDKATRTTELTWPLYSVPSTQLLGPSEDLALVGESAYFVAVRVDFNGQPLEPNELGGSFDLNKVSLRTGDVAIVPLPREMTNPRATTVDGELILYSGGGSVTWTLDEAANTVQPVAGKPRAAVISRIHRDGMPDPSSKLAKKAMPGTFDSLADGSQVFVDMSGAVQKVSKDGSAETLWNLSVMLPGTTPQQTRVIELN